LESFLVAVLIFFRRSRSIIHNSHTPPFHKALYLKLQMI